MQEILLKTHSLAKRFPIKGGIWSRTKAYIEALNDINLTLSQGETLGLVGESGSGKSTLGLCLSGLYQPDEGEVYFEQQPFSALSEKDRRPLRAKIQMIFQDPFESLNPRHNVEKIIGEPFLIHSNFTAKERLREIDILLERVGLDASAKERYSFEFSGGQRQRIGIARAIALKPKVLICDESVSALDVSIQAQIINLLLSLQQDLGLSYVFIAHNLAVVRHVSDRVAVMYQGRVVELAPALSLYKEALHPYTQLLMASIPEPNPKLSLKLPELSTQRAERSTQGCKFAPRCPIVGEECKRVEPKLLEIAPGHHVRCLKKNSIPNLSPGIEITLT